MYIKEIGVVKFMEVCKRIFDFHIHDYRFNGGSQDKDLPENIDFFLSEKLYPAFMNFDIGEWSLEKFMSEAAKGNKPGVHAFWLKNYSMKVIN